MTAKQKDAAATACGFFQGWQGKTVSSEAGIVAVPIPDYHLAKERSQTDCTEN